MQGRLSALDGSGSQPSPLYQPVIFGGEQAADRAVVQKRGIGPGMPVSKAKEMEGAGADAQTIFHTTGWYHAPDQQWKWVLPDRAANLKPEAWNTYTTGDPSSRERGGFPEKVDLKQPPAGKPYTLPDVLNHPDLYAAYPQLKSATVTRMRPEDSSIGAVAMYNPNNNSVQISGDRSKKEVMTSLLHEIQHGVQTYEGFGMGGGPNEFYPEGFAEMANPLTDKLNQASERLAKAGGNPGFLRYVLYQRMKGEPLADTETENRFRDEVAKLPTGAFNDYANAVGDYQPVQKIRDDAYENYLKVSGETESRQVEAQFKNQNWNQLPTQMEGFAPAGEQLVRRKWPGEFTRGTAYQVPTPDRHYPSQQVPDFTDKYNTYLDPDQEANFQTWLQDHAKSSGRDMSKDLDSYDLRGAYLNNVEQANNGHYPDTYKKPNHPGFSDQSIYHGVDGFEGGKWTQDPDDSDQWSYEPSASTLQMHGESGVRSYLQRGQGKDPPTQLILPKPPMSYEFSPVDHDPFIDYQPVEYDPFNQFVPVERDPFENRNKIVPPLILPAIQPSALGGGSWLDLAASAQGNQAPMAEPASLSQIAPPVNTVQPNYGGP